MNAEASAVRQEVLEREWWLRALAVLQSPRTVFAALRDDSREHAEARQEPILALLLLAGTGAMLSLSTTDTLLDYPTDGRWPIDATLLPVVLFLQGALYGVAAYWLGGGVVHLGLRGAGGEGSYRRTRHLLAFAAAPLVLGVVLVLPLKLAVYGEDAFRSGGGDAAGPDRWLFAALELGLVLWSAGLLVVAIRTVYGWSIPRALGSLALGAFALLGLALVALILSAN